MSALPPPAARAYEEARPAKAVRLLDEPDADAAALEGAREALVAWLRGHPEHLPAARDDLERLEARLKEARAAGRERAAHVEHEEAREVSEMLRGIPAEDAFKAHAALRRALQAYARGEAEAPAREEARLADPIPGFRGRLRGYQAEGARWLLARGLRGVLADEMGLGKTVTAIAAILAADERALVVCPANTLYNWRDEIERFTGEAPAIWHEGALHGDAGARFLATTYDALRNLPPEHARGRPVLVVDEAHYVRNPRTLRARLVAALPQRRRILLTGTPHVNALEDYHALLRQVDPARWGSLRAFRETWMPEPALYREHAQVREATATLLQRAASEHLLRRRKEEAEDLPPRIVRVRRHDPSSARMRRYRAREEEARERLAAGDDPAAAIDAIHRLRQELAAARVPAVLERVEDLVERGESVVVYAEYLAPLERLAARLGPRAAVIDGSTPPHRRQEIARAFGSREGPRVLLAQMQAGGVGLNLTAARHVIFLHLGWTAAVHAQAMDRVHRIGQDRPVIVEFFVTPGTLDERMADVLLRKQEEGNLVLDEEADVQNEAALRRLLDLPAPGALAAPD